MVVEAMLFYLISGNDDMRLDLVKTMTSGKNVQYIDKVRNIYGSLIVAR